VGGGDWNGELSGVVAGEFEGGLGWGAGGRRSGCAGGLGQAVQDGDDGLLLALDVVEDLLHAGHAGLEFVEGVVERLDLAGDLVGFCREGVLAVLHLELHAVDGDGHLVDGVGGLLDEVLENAHALVVGLLEACDGVLELLDLGLELDHVLVDGVSGQSGETHEEESRGGEMKRTGTGHGCGS